MSKSHLWIYEEPRKGAGVSIEFPKTPFIGFGFAYQKALWLQATTRSECRDCVEKQKFRTPKTLRGTVFRATTLLCTRMEQRRQFCSAIRILRFCTAHIERS